MSTPYVGEIRLFGFSRVPTGWLACDGSLQPISAYQTLYTLLGTTYGGDGVNTFAMPDMRGQIPLHQGTGLGLTPRVIGEVGGTESVTLTTQQMPLHTHTLNATTNNVSTGTPGNTVMPGALTNTDTMYATDLTGATNFTMAAAAVSTQGGSLPHENTMPTLTVSYCIAFAGIFPSQG
ncbi:microcystin dependent protein [Dyella lipolytica]|uniref:Phage tail protein n=1 Tax=Dyella lipolytica TaxID=1867835 RepID=A0ABW8IQ90_9GAMM|nr:tail fiber protein [Dyella lipolytica]GLQ45167.1 microcystin dependent protein [Dyella lipolytica]